MLLLSAVHYKDSTLWLFSEPVTVFLDGTYPHCGLLFRADDMSAAITMAKGGDTAGDMRRLEDALKRLRDIFQEANQLATGSQEAAAKCQVHFAES